VAVAGAAVAVLATAAGTRAAAAPEAPPSAREATAEGQWAGAVQTPGGGLEVTVDLEETADGWRGQIDIPAQGAEDLDLAGVAVDGDSVRFSIPGTPGDPTFRGTLSDDGEVLSGDFSQGGQTFPFELERVGPPQLVTGPSTEDALDGYRETIEAAMEAWRVPGAAVAVVRDGEVVHAQGYGVREAGSDAAVTDSTVFPIGSMTKSFTSLLAGALVEEGRLAWDEPVRERLPEFRLHEEYAGDHATLVDLLSHRTGLPRHDLLWIAWEEADSTITRRDYLRTLRHLPPSEPFRAAFQYNNFMYAAAGHMAGRAGDGSWEGLVRDRFLEPLGMRRTTFTVDSMQSLPDHARGHRVVDAGSDDARAETVEAFRIDAMGPAGSINSSVLDMAAWLELHASGGEVDGRRVVPEAAVEATHRRRIPVHGGPAQLLTPPEMPQLDYALGWMVQNYRGHELLHHGGGITGFTSLMGVLPREDLGVVILTNRSGGAFTYAVLLETVDRFLGLDPKDWIDRFRELEEQAEQAQQEGEEDGAGDGGAEEEGAPPARPLEAYAGTYRHPAYGPLQVRNRADSLTARLGTLGIALRHRRHGLFDAEADEPLLEGFDLAFHFETGRSGEIEAVTVPLEPAVDPIRFERQAPARMRDPAFLDGLTGDYRVAGMTVEIRMRGERSLVFRQPGASAELVPVRGTRFRLEGQENTAVEFVLEDGEATGLVIHQGGRTFEGEKVE
jgi:CubicO group peptidase (beta-lactamase class C family)